MRSERFGRSSKTGGWAEFDIGRPPPQELDWDRQPDGLTIFIRKGAVELKYVICGAVPTLMLGVGTIIAMVNPSSDKLYEFLFWDLPGNVLFPIITLFFALMTLLLYWGNLHQWRIYVTREHLRLYLEAPSGKHKGEKTIPIADIKEVRVANPDEIRRRSDCLKRRLSGPVL